MKLITALIRPEQLPAVKQALFDAQIRHMTATNTLGTSDIRRRILYCFHLFSDRH